MLSGATMASSRWGKSYCSCGIFWLLVPPRQEHALRQLGGAVISHLNQTLASGFTDAGAINSVRRVESAAGLSAPVDRS
jgi:hypothetical protein